MAGLWLFAFFGVIAAFSIGDAVQTNSMVLVGKSVFNIPVVVTGIVLAFLA
jgi:Na+/alanine symporter